MFAPKIATYQLLCVTPHVNAVPSHQATTQQQTMEQAQRQLLWKLMNWGPSVPASSAHMSTIIYKDGVFFR